MVKIYTEIKKEIKKIKNLADYYIDFNVYCNSH